jgi:hydroxymethylbilane synthase
MTQSRWVASELRRIHAGLEVEIIQIKTTGDKNLGASLAEIGGKGAFTKELEDAILESRCDIAVHSQKDLPTKLPDGLRILCTPPREDTADVVVMRQPEAATEQPLGFIPTGMTIGTSSLRRRAQLAHLRPDLQVIEFRGNVDSRLRKLKGGEAFACILAAAGVKRLGLVDGDTVDGLPASFLHPPEWLPAVGQGALGIEGRAADELTAQLLAPLHDAATFAATAAERAFLSRLGAGCQAPVGALGLSVEGSSLRLKGRILSPDGKTAADHEALGKIDQPESLGKLVAEACLGSSS